MTAPENNRPRRFRSLEDFQNATGTVLGVSTWVEVAQDRIDLFAAATGDYQWIHVDPQRAVHGPFGTTIAHGYLTLSMIPVFLAETYVVDGVSSVLNYGLGSVRFPHPVPEGSRLRGTVSLQRADRVATSLRVVLDVVIEVEGASKPACAAEVIHLLVESGSQPVGQR